MDINKALPRRSDRNVVARCGSIGGDGDRRRRHCRGAARLVRLVLPVQTLRPRPPVSAMKTIPWLAALVAAALATPAGADGTRHELSATSKAVIEIGPDGIVIMHATNVRLVPYALFDGEHQLPRVATVNSDVRQRTDAEGDDPASTVAVTVDDLSAATPRRLASFTDPGSEGVLLGPSWFDTRQPGCCAGPTVHSLRALETGRLLYRATGDGEASAAWGEIPNARPALIRWAAFAGRIDQAD